MCISASNYYKLIIFNRSLSPIKEPKDKVENNLNDNLKDNTDNDKNINKTESKIKDFSIDNINLNINPSDIISHTDKKE